MQSAIDIRVISSGERLDISDKESFEINMGGVSLLNLADRTATYSNSFKLPRTPNNEKILSFSSLSTVNVRPSIEVIITKGLFQRKATLKVLSFDKVYSCSVNYYAETSSLEILKNTNAFFFPDRDYHTEVKTTYGAINVLSFLTHDTIGDQYGCPVIDKYKDVPNYEADATSTGLGYRFKNYLAAITQLTGVQFDGDVFGDADFHSMCVINPYAYRTYTISYLAPNYTAVFYERCIFAGQKCKYKVTDVLKSLCQIFRLNVEEVNGVIYLNSMSSVLGNTPISIEGFTSITKNINSGLAFQNKINYDLADKDILGESYGSDTVTADGIGSKEMIKMNAYVPKLYDVQSSPQVYAYEFQKQSSFDKMIILKLLSKNINSFSWWYYTFPSGPWVSQAGGFTNFYTLELLDMSGVYSIDLGLDSIFLNPIVLDVNKWLNPLEADELMTTRVINSVQLGGKYWVDSMAYNLQTGQAKLKLIRL